jgi:hypothetical protein
MSSLKDLLAKTKPVEEPAPIGLGIKIKLGNFKTGGGYTKPEAKPEVPKAEAVITKVNVDDFNHPDMAQKFTPGDMNGIQEALEILRTSIDNLELVGNATRNILLSIKEHPEFADILRPEDCQLMIRGLRESHGITVSSKIANKEKKTKNSESVQSVSDMIGDIEFDVG